MKSSYKSRTKRNNRRNERTYNSDFGDTLLDLHGVRHPDVDREVENFVLLNQTPMKVITGNSSKMRDLVKDVLMRHKFNFEVPSNNNGMIRVYG